MEVASSMILALAGSGDVSALSMILALVGGLGLFLYGMKVMGDGLQNLSGDKMKAVFEKITSNPILGVMTGAFVTAVIQSSSATTVMVVGFVNAGLMNLFQATAVIMGANIGTTVTAKLITLKISHMIPIFLGIGGFMTLFGKKERTKEIGHIILGFGILFLGMDLMKDAMKPLRSNPMFEQFVLTLDGNWFLGLLTGLVMTAVVQSSSATTGILIGLASTGMISLEIAIPILFGCNIGTCVTALISSIGTNKNAKKAAFVHFIFNVVGALIFIPLRGLLAQAVYLIPTSGTMEQIAQTQIANAHMIFNVANTVLLLPFYKVIVSVVNKIIPDTVTDEEEHVGTKYIDDRLLETPVIAVGQTTKECIRMGNIVEKNLKLAMDAFEKNDDSLVKKVYEKEKLVNLLEDELTVYLIKLSKTEIAEHQRDIVTSMFHVVNDLERVGDHAENIAELTSEKIQKRLNFSDEAIQELKNMFNYTIQAVRLSIEALDEENKEKAFKVIEIEDKIDKIEKELRANHIRRLNNGVCNATVGAIFLDIISNLERIGDHATNVAQAIVN
ncbi:Na/Pi cotransporter family protein [Oceanirhabdus sp. W0125-5]|uniref:Na/Pi cotransporter family protein n=1 Tax=Oceanirhabdus sp. W0125-5 TaxID=2999116 RepID=UPI0022F30283|nr:Na/Pi cotransporter family protein [Oceanirhabdus sp. W0125-5]WBW98029.1 Na/Pi cotransporter family protein [Oceanirhabdus sp. W0125-5]